MSIEDQLRALIERHCLTIRHSVHEIGHTLAALREPGATPCDAVTRAEAIAHQLKGSSGSVGFGVVSAAATELDNHLKALLVADDEEIDRQAGRTGMLFAELHEAAAAMTTESSSLFRADLTAFGGGL